MLDMFGLYGALSSPALSDVTFEGNIGCEEASAGHRRLGLGVAAELAAPQ